MITVTILTKNCEQTLPSTLESVKDFSEVIVYDTGSIDSTIEVARKFPNVKVIQGQFIGFGPTHNVASQLAQHDWILSLDSDEILTPELAKEILSLLLDPEHVYLLNRKNFFNKKWIKWCGGWHPDQIVRLYHRQKTHFTDAQVHEKIVSSHLQKTLLGSPLLHTPYRNMSDFLNKMQIYSTLFAEQNRSRKESSITKAIVHGWQAFIKSYIYKRGFLGGKEGFIISVYNGHTAFYKYLKLMEVNRDSSNDSHHLI